MAESNATQVILTDDGLKIINAQTTADEAAGNINDINSDNKLTPSEKLKLKQEYDKDVELYNIDIEQLKSVDLSTAELDTAMSNLKNFVTPLFEEMNITSTIDRDTLDSVFTAFAAADKNASQAFANMVQQVADDAKKAGDDAKEAGQKAQAAGEEAQASATQAQADATQAKADAANAQQALNNIHLDVKNADGSTATFNMNSNTILLDANEIILSGDTSIQDGTIGTAKIANAAINTAQIADGAINNAKIANASIDDAKINSLNGNKIIAGSITSAQLNADDIIANVINGKTINGITINTPNLNLGTNGVLNENWNLNQDTGWFQPKKGIGTTTLDMGVLRMNGNLSRWWNGDGSDQYWYGISDNGDKIKNGSNVVTDDYAPGYEKHDIVGSSGVLLRSYLDATGLYLNQNSTKTVMVALTQQGLDTGGYIHAQQNSVVDKWFDAGVDSGTGIRIGYRAIQAHGSNDIYFNTDSTVGALTLHAKNFSASSQLSRKKDISPLEEEQAMETIMNTDIYRYHYKDETESEPYNYSVIIDDIHEKSQYKTPEEFIIADRTGRNDGNAIGFLIQALKNANRRILALEEIINEGKE
ncbi:hypothetical protein RAO19_00445 [Pediococcus acidilactici]